MLSLSIRIVKPHVTWKVWKKLSRREGAEKIAHASVCERKAEKF